MNESLLKSFLGASTYDIRRIRDGTWIDQKCAPDEIRFVAECIIAYLDETNASTFQSSDVWHSSFASRQVQIYFGKPDPFSKEAVDEYNKFFRRPMKMFAVAGILGINGRFRNGIQFFVRNRDVLKFIARNDWNAYLFLTHYVEKVLKDSGIWDLLRPSSTNKRLTVSFFSRMCSSYSNSRIPRRTRKWKSGGFFRKS